METVHFGGANSNCDCWLLSNEGWESCVELGCGLLGLGLVFIQGFGCFFLGFGC